MTSKTNDYAEPAAWRAVELLLTVAIGVILMAASIGLISEAVFLSRVHMKSHHEKEIIAGCGSDFVAYNEIEAKHRREHLLPALFCLFLSCSLLRNGYRTFCERV